MKKIIIVVILFLFISSCHNDKKKIEPVSDINFSTYYFIRHAEKDRSDPTNEDPHLLEKGKQRAEHWATVFKNIDFDAVYSTDYNRTRETAQPTANKNNLNLTLYHPKNMEMIDFLRNTKGKSVLVVGHSNSTPEFVNAILGTKKYEHIDDNNNANLYIVTISGDIISNTLLQID